MKHDYETAIEAYKKAVGDKQISLAYVENEKVILHALAMMQKLQEPSEGMWSGLARAIVMGRDMNCLKRGQMREHLRNSGYVELSPAIEKELQGDDIHMAKGDVAVLILKAMIEQAEKEIGG